MSTPTRSKSIGWNEVTESTLVEYGDDASAHTWLHKNSASYLSGQLERCSLWAAVLSSLSSASGVTSMVSQVFDDIYWLALSFTIFSLAVSLATTWILVYIKNKNFTDKIKRHKDAEQHYRWLTARIQGQMQLRREERGRGHDFCAWIAHYVSSVSSTEDIEEAVRQQYNRMVGDLPDVDDVRRIKVMSPADETTMRRERLVNPLSMISSAKIRRRLDDVVSREMELEMLSAVSQRNHLASMEEGRCGSEDSYESTNTEA